MLKITNLESHKEIKKIKKILTDLEKIQGLLTLIAEGLSGYKKYTPVKNVISAALENKAMVNIYLQKTKETLKEKQQ